MKNYGKVTIIFLLLTSLITSNAFAKSANVLLQEALYAEEMEGDLNKAIEIYQQIAVHKKADNRTRAQAMYRQGMCHMKLRDEQRAKAVFQKLAARFPDQKEIVKKAKSLLKGMNGPDPAELMPPETGQGEGIPPKPPIVSPQMKTGQIGAQPEQTF